MAEGGDGGDPEAELNRLKTEIIVCIIPEKDPIPAYQVNKYYKEEWRNRDIPFQKYGFPNLDAFLCSLSDAINMCVIGGQKCYKAATMDSTKHVQQLVQRQKSKVKPKKRGMRSVYGGMARGGYHSSYTSRGMGFAGPARTAPPHLSATGNNSHEGKQRILTLLRRAGGEAFYADIQRMYSDEYHRNLDQQELRRLFGPAIGTAVRTLESQFRTEMHVTEPSQGRLHLKLRDFTAPSFGASSMRGGPTAFRGGRAGFVAGNNARPQAPTAFSKFIPPRLSSHDDDLPNMFDRPSSAAATASFARSSNNTAPSLTVRVGENGANRQVTSAAAAADGTSSNPIMPLRHSEILPANNMPFKVSSSQVPSTHGFVAPSLPSVNTTSRQAVPPPPERHIWAPNTSASSSSSSMSAMAQISNRTPTIVKLLEQLVAMLAKRHPRGIALTQLDQAYKQDHDMPLDTLAIYRKSWQELITGQFRDRVVLDSDNVVHLSPKELPRLSLPNASSAVAARTVQQPQTVSVPRSSAAPIATTSAPLARPASVPPPSASKTPSASSSSANVGGGASATGAELTDNIRRLFELASREPEGLPIVRVAAIIGYPEAEALRIAVIQYPTYFQIKFVEGTCYVIAKRDVVLPPPMAQAAAQVAAQAAAQVAAPARPTMNATPVDFVLPKQSVGFDLTLPISTNEDADSHTIEVQVSDYQSPMRFSLVLRENVEIVTELQRQLAAFYANLSVDECRLPADELVPGRICAVEYLGNGDFHRAKIVDVDDDRTMAEVAYVDYGSRQKVPTKFICQLDQRFTTLPAQALLASFLEVRPPRGQQDFSDDLGLRMGDMCNTDNRAVWALIVEYKAAEEKMIVELCQKSFDEDGQEQDLWVMEALRAEGLLEVVDHDQSAASAAMADEADDDEVNALAEMLDDVDFIEDDDFEDELGDDNESSHSAMSEYRRQLKADPKFVHTLRNMTRIYSSIRHQKLESMGTSSGQQQLVLAEEIAKIERDLRTMNDMINQHENEPPRNSSPPEDPSPAAN